MKLSINFLVTCILCSTTPVAIASTATSPNTVVVPPPPAVSSSSGGGGGSNPVFQLAGYVKDSFVRMKDGTVQLYTNHQRCNTIRAKQKEYLQSYVSSLPSSTPEKELKAASKYRMNAGGISYEEFDFLQKGKEDRGRLANIAFMMVFAPNFVPYAFMFFPEMLPSSFNMPPANTNLPGGAGGIPPTKWDLLSRERSHAVLQTLIDVERSARVAPLISNLNPFGKGKTRRMMEKMDRLGQTCGALLAADGASGTQGAELIMKVLEDEIYTTDQPKKDRTALTIIPKVVMKGLGKALEAPSSSLAFMPTFLLRGKVLNTLMLITASDEFLVDQNIDLNTLSSDLLQDACSKRLIGGPGRTNEEMIHGLSSWLELSVKRPAEKVKQSGTSTSTSSLHYNGNLARAALLSYNAVDGARDARASSFLPRLMFQGQLYSKAANSYITSSSSSSSSSIQKEETSANVSTEGETNKESLSPKKLGRFFK
jgi:hypothetical protein